MQNNKALFVSITLSCLTILLSIFAWSLFVDQNMPDEIFLALSKNWFIVMFFYFLVVFVSAIIGMKIGIKKIKTANRMVAILSIIISVLAMIVTLFSGYAVELSIVLQTT